MDKSFKIFFRYLIVGFIISSIRVNIIDRPILTILNDIFLLFMYNGICGISIGLSAMFDYFIYLKIKKNLKNEECGELDRLVKCCHFW